MAAQALLWVQSPPSGRSPHSPCTSSEGALGSPSRGSCSCVLISPRTETTKGSLCFVPRGPQGLRGGPQPSSPLPQLMASFRSSKRPLCFLPRKLSLGTLSGPSLLYLQLRWLSSVFQFSGQRSLPWGSPSEPRLGEFLSSTLSCTRWHSPLHLTPIT